jgi:hypothetical protein
VASTRPAVPDRRVAHLVCDLVREGVPLSAVTKGLGLRDQAIRNALYLGTHGGPERYRELVEWVEDARREREAYVAELLDAARRALRV